MILSESAETAVTLLEDLRVHRLDARDLTVQQRRSCLLLMANGSQTSAEIAAVFRVSPSCIRRDLQAIRTEVGRIVRGYTIEEVLGQLALASEKCTAMAMKESDPGLAWTIQRDFAKLLKEFGVVSSTEERNSFTVTIEAIGKGYERATKVLGRVLDPRLTGEILDPETMDVSAEVRAVPALALGGTLDPSVAGSVPDSGEHGDQEQGSSSVDDDSTDDEHDADPGPA